MDLKKYIRSEGIPITWETNLEESDIRDLYIALCHANDEQKAHYEAMGISDFDSKRVFNAIPIKDGFCICDGEGEDISAIYRTAQEWHAHWREIERLKQEKEQEKDNAVRLIMAKDYDLREKAKKALSEKRYEDVVSCLEERIELRSNNEQYRSNGSWIWDYKQDFINLLASLPNGDRGVDFLNKYYPIWDWFTGLARAWVFWRVTYHVEGDSNDITLLTRFKPAPMPMAECLEEVKTIARAGMAAFPDDGFLHKEFCLLFDRHGDVASALWVCRNAVERGLNDYETKTGFIGRLKRLEAKARKLNLEE
jgi:hypothetical protein